MLNPRRGCRIAIITSTVFSLLSSGAVCAQGPSHPWSPDETAAFLDRAREVACRGRLNADWTSGTLVLSDMGGRSFVLKSGRLVPLSESDANVAPRPRELRNFWPLPYSSQFEQPSPDGSLVAGLNGNNLVLQSARDSAVRQVTKDGTDDAPYLLGKDPSVAAGDTWSADSRQLVVARMDMSQVQGFPIIDYLQPQAEAIEWSRFWGGKVGQPLPNTTLYVVDAQSGRIRQLPFMATADQTLAFLDWDPNGNEIFALRGSRDMTHVELLATDLRSGTVRTVIDDRRDDGYVSFWSFGSRIFWPLENGQFLWHSNRSGYASIELYESDGSMLRALTSDVDVVSIDALFEGYVYFHARSDPNRPYDVHFHRLQIGQDKVERLTKFTGQNSARLSPDGRYFVVVHEDVGRPPSTELYRSDGSLVQTLTQGSMAGLEDWSIPEPFVAPSRASDQVHGIILKPHGFDPTKLYPVVERIYGGMQAAEVPRGFLGLRCGGPEADYVNMLAWLNRLGFAVVIMDAPGTPGLGVKFNMVTWRSWPDGIVDDHVTALRHIAAKRGYLDLSRLGIEGNSWGGFLALRAAIEAPTFYRAVSASVPNLDPVDSLNTVEYMLGTIGENREHYYAASVLRRVEDINAPLLLIAGTSDGNVPLSNTMKLLDGLTRTRKFYDLVIFPGADHGHQLKDGTSHYPYAVTRIGGFFQRELGGVLDSE